MIDWDRIVELRREVGEEDFQDVVELFLDEVESEIANLTSMTEAKALECALHSLKGSALNLGFSEFADLCSTGEICARNGNTDAVDLEEIIASYRTSTAEFTKSIRRTVAA